LYCQGSSGTEWSNAAVLILFLSLLELVLRRDGRVVECGGLENR
jgi:hypothetical protein